MKRLLFILLMPTLLLGQTNVYIDPTAPNGVGTIESPYDGWGRVDPLQSNYNYYQKAGTTATYSGIINISGKSNILVTSYGSGVKPIIDPGTAPDVFAISNSSDITIRNIDCYKGRTGTTRAMINMSVTPGNIVDDILIDSCRFEGNLMGVRALAYGGGDYQDITLNKTEIFNCDLDGVYGAAYPTDYFDNFIIDSCWIHDINIYWNYYSQHEDTSAGDGIQLLWVQHFELTNSIVDHRSTSNKFCVLLTLSEGGTALLQNDTLFPPKDSIHPGGYGSAGSALYPGSGMNKITMDHCVITNKGSAQFGGTGKTPAFNIEADTAVLCYNNIDSTGKMYFHSSYTKHIEMYNNNICSPMTNDDGYLLNYANANFTGSFKNNIVLVPVGMSPVYGTGSRLVKSNNITVASDPSGWNATYGFTDYATGDYSISAGSSLRNAGTTSFPGMLTDIVGTEVPQESIYDIGAYEYDAAETPPIVANFTAFPLSVTEGGTVQFTTVATRAPITYSWIFEGGTPATSTDQNPLITYSTPGIYDVTLTVDDGVSNDSEIKLNYIEVVTAEVPAEGNVLTDATGKVLIYGGKVLKY